MGNRIYHFDGLGVLPLKDFQDRVYQGEGVLGYPSPVVISLMP